MMGRAELRSGFRNIAGRAANLSGDWNRPAIGYEGWNCKDLLAHITSTAAALPAVAATVYIPEAEAREGAAFDADRWNASQVRRRKEVGAVQLVAELTEATDALDVTLADLDLTLKVRAGPYSGLSADDAMADMIKHQNDHLDDLEALLSSRH